MNPDFRIRPGTMEEAVAISQAVPELVDPYGMEEYEKRMGSVPYLILVAELPGGELIGFKAGYEREVDGTFYSWMGGVRPKYRRQKVAQKLGKGMEAWARAQGYTKLTFKTRNCHRGMLHYALHSDYQIIGFEAADEVAQHRIWLEKVL